SVAVSNEGDYDLLFKDLTQRISISGDAADFSIDHGMLQLTDTLEPAEIIALPVSFHPTTTGTKQITLTINSNDPNTPAYTLTVTGTATDIPTSILNRSEQNIAVYPNPTTGILHIDSQQPGTLNVQVTNLQGQTVKKQTLTDDTAGLDISALPDGFYVVKITGDQSSAVVKVLKQ
ncbi:T9SS type A sorting domain-containing protein, partial [Cytophaga hutchinsonii]